MDRSAGSGVMDMDRRIDADEYRGRRGAAYELGGFGVVYPVARAVSVLLVVPLATQLAGDRLGLAALAGIGLITVSLVLLASSASRDRACSAHALAWIFVAGLATADCVMCDAHGVRLSGSPWAYGFAVAVTNAAAMCWRQRHIGTPGQLFRSNWAIAVATAPAVVSYLLIL
jgi:hypothetical protein